MMRAEYFEPRNKAPKVSEMTHMFTQWGRFIIHDIVHTPVILAEDGSDLDCNCDNPHPECINIPIPRTDEQESGLNRPINRE